MLINIQYYASVIHSLAIHDNSFRVVDQNDFHNLPDKGTFVRVGHSGPEHIPDD